VIKYYVESIQTGHSLFTKEKKAEKTKNLLISFLDKYFGEIIDRKTIYLSHNASWLLNVDVILPSNFLYSINYFRRNEFDPITAYFRSSSSSFP